MQAHWVFRSWIVWLMPVPWMVWYLKRNFQSVVLYQDVDVTIEMRRRGKVD